MRSRGALLVLLSLAACTDETLPRTPPAIRVVARDTRFVVREHMIASLEMQLSGEPFAEAMGRDLGDYSRDHLPADLRFEPGTRGAVSRVDLAGFSAGIESYEYSKQPMNNLAFESGAGTSLAFGPLLDPTGGGGAAACAALRERVQGLGAASRATSRFVHAGGDARNPLGWPGIWPAMEPFVSFDPAIAATHEVALTCSITSDDDPGLTGALLSDDYECDATTLRLRDRDAQVDRAISPGASGWAGWKSALWVLNYLQSMHDAAETAVATVPTAELGAVGATGNAVRGNDEGAVPGTFLGSSDIEGFQAGLMLTALDNEAQHWLGALTTTDGRTLGGFADLREALAYDAAAPARWFPAEVAVTERVEAGCELPRPVGYAVRVSPSRLLDLAGVLGAYASVYALTDHANAEVGGSQPARAYFDGEPFADDDQRADGDATVHDRALAMLRVGLVTLRRLHVDPGTGLPVDEATPGARGSTLSAPVAAYTLLALRTTRRALSSELTLYGDLTPDTATVSTPLDAPPIAGGVTVTTVLNESIRSLAALFYDRLTDGSGRAFAGWDLAAGTPTSAADLLDAHTAAVRALLVAYLATGETRFRDRALAVFGRVEARFYDPTARVYRTVADDRSATVTYTPLRFGLLQAMLRDVYELIATTPAHADLAPRIESRVGRLNKLVLNGWDDRDRDERVDWPGECAQVEGGLPRGGLQMAERTLTGETGSLVDVVQSGPRIRTTDRERDCVPEISAAGLPAALAASVTFQVGEGAP